MDIREWVSVPSCLCFSLRVRCRGFTSTVHQHTNIVGVEEPEDEPGPWENHGEEKTKTDLMLRSERMMTAVSPTCSSVLVNIGPRVLVFPRMHVYERHVSTA